MVQELEPWLKIRRRRTNVLKEQMMFVEGKKRNLLQNKNKNGGESGWKADFRMICKRLAHPDDHLQIGGPIRMIWSFAQGRPICMIICTRPDHLHDHLQKGQPIQMIICKRPAHPDDQQQQLQQQQQWQQQQQQQQLGWRGGGHQGDRGDQGWRDRKRRRRSIRSMKIVADGTGRNRRLYKRSSRT